MGSMCAVLASATPATAAGCALGVVAITAALWLWRARSGDAPESAAEIPGWTGRLRAWRAGLSEPTRTVLALSIALAGYHAAAWTSPDAWFALKVPVERWWIVALGLGSAIAASLWMDRMDRAGESERGDGNSGRDDRV